jgi:hypothetical protein
MCANVYIEYLWGFSLTPSYVRQAEVAQRTQRIAERMQQARRNPALETSPPKQRFILSQYDHDIFWIPYIDVGAALSLSALTALVLLSVNLMPFWHAS